MGGVQTGTHARDLLSAGANLVAVGTETFRDPLAASRIAEELEEARKLRELPPAGARH
jgi:dihydroorotate dehydrogenase (NAD+) catalytic subunit